MSGPPELPGLIAASVWIAFVEIVSPASFLEVTVRLRLETIPSVTELAYLVPRGLPIAMATSPTLILVESANLAIVLILSAAILTTARSERSEDTSELQSRQYIVCRLLLEKKVRQVV